MSITRAQRRAMKRSAPAVAAKLASGCYDFLDGGIVPVDDAQARAALCRAFTALLKGGDAKPVVMPIRDAEADGFPRYRANRAPGGVTWLAAGFDADGCASYALHTAWGGDAAAEARLGALVRLAHTVAEPGFPMGEAKGRA